jgi:predicted transcriptional regulator
MKNALIDVILNSEKRKNVLLLLIEGEKSREEIKTSLNVTSTALIPQIKILKENGLVIQEGDYYTLTNMGEVLVENMLPLLDVVEVFEENRTYWKNRNLNGVPKSLLKRFGELGSCLIIEPDLNYLFEFPREFTENIVKSEYILAYNAYFHPEYPAMYSRLAEKGIDISLILTDAVYERMEQDFTEDIEKFNNFETTELRKSDEMTGLATLVSTDRFLFLCFFNEQGQYDHTILMSFDSNALQWSEELFEYYKERSEIID